MMRGLHLWVLRRRVRVLHRTRDRYLRLIEKWAGIGDPEMIRDWQGKIVEANGKLTDVEERLRRAEYGR